MKTRLFNTLLLVLAVSFASAQTFIGKITYDIDYELPEAMESQRAMLPSEMIMYIGKQNTRIEQKTMMGDQIVISNTKEKTAVLLMNMMGQKMAIKMDNKDAQEAPKPVIEYVSGIKNIAGYSCKKAIVKSTDESGEEQSLEVYYTEEIPAEANDKLPGLKGFPLEYGMNTQGMLMTLTAKEISKEKIAKQLFEIPEGYETMTMEDFMKSMGGGQ